MPIADEAPETGQCEKRQRGRPRKQPSESFSFLLGSIDACPSSRMPGAIPTLRPTRHRFHTPEGQAKLAAHSTSIMQPNPITLTELAKQHGIPKSTLCERIHRGLDAKKRGAKPVLEGLEAELANYAQWMATFGFPLTEQQPKAAARSLAARHQAPVSPRQPMVIWKTKFGKPNFARFWSRLSIGAGLTDVCGHSAFSMVFRATQ
jgi:hypothetical protein